MGTLIALATAFLGKMTYLSQVFVGLATAFVGKTTSLVLGLPRVLTAVVNTFWQQAERFLVRPVLGITGVIWSAVVVVWLVGVGLVLNLAGVDVYDALDGLFGNDDRPSVPDPGDIQPEDVTDDQGHFCADGLRRTTGLDPTEFIHLVVQGNGGRIEQATLVTYLPWSDPTVCRYLDALEEERVIERVSIGNRNLVCTPDRVPEGVGATPDAVEGGDATDREAA
jgi:hypothetical protein